MEHEVLFKKKCSNPFEFLTIDIIIYELMNGKRPYMKKIEMK